MFDFRFVISPFQTALKKYFGGMDLKESCTTEKCVVAVVGDGSWFYWVNEVAVHPPGGQESLGNCYW